MPSPFPLLRRLALLCLAAALPAIAAVPPPVDRTVELGPEVVARRAELNKKARVTKRAHWAGQMETVVAQIATDLQISATQKQALAAAAGTAVDLSLEEWIKMGQGNWVKWMPDNKEAAMEMLEQAIAGMEINVQTEYPGQYTLPQAQAAWSDGLKRTLTPEQLAQWDAAEQKRMAALDQETRDVLQTGRQAMREQLRNSLTPRIAAIRSALPLPPERVAELDKFADRLADTLADQWREDVRHSLLTMSEETRRQWMQPDRLGTHNAMPDSDAAEKRWAEGLAALLSADERKQIEGTRDLIRTRRTKALGQALIAMFDEEVACTSEQREKLRTLAEAAAKSASALFPAEAEAVQHYQINRTSMLAVGRNVPEANLKAILDATQLRRWQEASAGKSPSKQRSHQMMAVIGGDIQPAAKPGASTPLAPEEIEAAISDALFDRTQAERRRLLAGNSLKAEDAARIAGLPPELAQKLATAARGMTEEALESWKSSMEESARSQLTDVTAENLRQRLANMDRNQFFRPTRKQTPGDSLFTKSLETVLTADQRRAWEAEVAARLHFREQAIAGLIMTDFARRVPLSAGQWGRLEPLVRTAVQSYGQAIETMFSYYDTEWFMQSNSLYVPFAAVPEADMKDILGAAGWDAWTKSQEYANTQNYWEHVQRIRAERVRIKTP